MAACKGVLEEGKGGFGWTWQGRGFGRPCRVGTRCESRGGGGSRVGRRRSWAVAAAAELGGRVGIWWAAELRCGSEVGRRRQLWIWAGRQGFGECETCGGSGGR